MTPAQEVALGCRVLAAHGNADLVWGHLSRRDPDGEDVWLKAAGFGMEEITADRVVRIDRRGRPIGGKGRVHLEYPIHTAIMAARPDVGAIVHSHGESAVAFAATGLPLRPVGHEGTLFWPPDIARFTETGDLIHTPELGEAVAAALGDRNALLLHRHGLVTVGPDVPTAVMTAIFLEKACRMQLAVAAASGSSPYFKNADAEDAENAKNAEHTENAAHFDPAEALAKRDRCYGPRQLADAWAYLVRSLKARG
ncbi:class II aldolase/adducin family protein [Streptomyces sp. NPDC059256]|uniref:class II aldolase/adducin family protein n=1 Tax=Streptomyces sp. NPDC059256 TaxID=3346794 RepID=UPI0036CB095B